MRLQPLARFRSYVELRDFVYATICDREQFAEDVFPMVERKLMRGDRTCGFLFSVYGPRSVVCNAVFELSRNMVHFYSASGERVLSQTVFVAG